MIADPSQFVHAQKRVLEDLFGTAFFGSPSTTQHPAVERWSFCNRLLANDVRIGLQDQGTLVKLAELVLDNGCLVMATRGNVDQFTLGSLANYGDAAVQRRLRSVIQDPQMFRDVLVELNYAAWNVSRGHSVTAFELDGFPDFEIRISSPPTKIVAECKRVQASSSRKRFPKLVNKANKQIKELAGSAIGLLVIDITERTPRVTDLGGKLSPEIEEVFSQVLRSMQHRNSSVSGAILTWRDAVILPMKDGSGGTLCVLRQRERLIRHNNPLTPFPDNDSFLSFGYTISYKVLPA